MLVHLFLPPNREDHGLTKHAAHALPSPCVDWPVLRSSERLEVPPSVLDSSF